MSSNHYGTHPFMVDSGTFWRCRHGAAPIKYCHRCGIHHPIRHVVAIVRYWKNRNS